MKTSVDDRCICLNPLKKNRPQPQQLESPSTAAKVRVKTLSEAEKNLSSMNILHAEAD